MIKQIIDRNSNLRIFFDAVENNKKISLLNCGEGEMIQLLDEINHPKLFVVPNKDEANKFAEKFKLLNFKVNVCTDIPDLFLSDYSVGENEYLNFLTNLNNSEIDIHIITPNVIMLPLPKTIINSTFNISEGDDISIDELVKKLSSFGYKKVESISCSGEIVTRGEIVDIVKFGTNDGVRITFDYDTISKIQILDDSYIQVKENINSISFGQTKYLSINLDATNSIIAKSKNAEIKKLFDNYLEFNSNYNNLWFLPFSEEELVSLYSVVSIDTIIAFSDIKQVWDSAENYIKEYDQKIKNGKENNLLLRNHTNPLRLENLTLKDVKNTCLGFQFINNANRIFTPNSVFSFKCMPNIHYGENYKSLVIDLINYNKQGFTTIVFVDEINYNQCISRLRGNVNFVECKNIFSIQKQNINIIKKEFLNSFNFFEEKIACIGSNCIGKTVYKVKEKVDLSSTDILTEIELPKANDYVVHKIHGIGKCLGIQNLTLSKDLKKDYIVIEYKNEDKLYLPIENVDSITKYIADTETPTLNKLGGTEFRKVKDKIKSSVKDIAENLIKIYKEREESKGFKFPHDDDIQSQFENDFPYPLTFDQQQTIETIKEEMVSGKLIDRLICGDVGFGKTEVAMRIAFKTLLAGKNVAVLCPTTILSEQHYTTFSNRMEKYGININVLNRFKTTAETKKIIEDINHGKINLIIGTHKLLNDKIQFKNLGLLIIDEEQKFGVEHKEKIKNLKKQVNVLTLSATPIPRTLHLSLSGIRDISTIQTPPSNKITTQVSVMEYNDFTIKLAVEKEIDRGGQVLIIYNKVETIDQISKHFSKLLDNKYIIDTAHGQMSSNILEDKIMQLYNGKTQILVSTTLIENGVDLPNANTLIILESNKLGLSQLYQLKGRVGRGSRESYAYFMYSGSLTDIAYKRLKAISEFTSMGSGFKISMRDMELRGAGNIFGAQQHGHLDKIGYSMYMSILNSSIEEIKNKVNTNKLYQEIRIETDMPTNIPNSSVFNTNQKMSLYSRIAQIDTAEKYNDIMSKINDICNEIPKSLENLCKFSLIKNKLYKYKATKLIVKNSDFRIIFDKNVNIEHLSNLINKNNSLDLDGNVSLVIRQIDKNKILDYLISIL